MRPAVACLLALSLTGELAAQRRPRRHRRARLTPAVTAPTSATPSATRPIDPEGFTLRPIDRATVRVLVFQGVEGGLDRGRSGTLRLFVNPSLTFGSGVVVRSDGVVLTARHVIEGADAVAVLFPGQRVAVPAVVVANDPAHDVAFLALQTTAPIADVVPLPTAAEVLTSGQRVLVSGYPLDRSERYPAAVAGEFARVNNDGRVQLSVSTNPGNSGGPVLDDAGRLLGVVSRGSAPENGVQGLALIEPIRTAVELWNTTAARAPRPTFADNAAELAWGIHQFATVNPIAPDPEAIDLERVLSLARTPLAPHEAALVGGLAWNAALIELERCRSINLASLPADRRDLTRQTLRVVGELLARAHREAPYLAGHGYPFIQWHSALRGVVVAPASAPLRAVGNETGEVVSPTALLDDLRDPSPWTVEPIARRPLVAPTPPVASCLRNFVGPRLMVPRRVLPTPSPEVVVRLRVADDGVVQGASLHQGTRIDALDGALEERLRELAAQRPRIDCLSPDALPAVRGREVSISFMPIGGR